MLHLKRNFVALSTVVDFRFMLHVAERAVTVVRCLMGIDFETFGLLGKFVAVVTLQAGLFVRIGRILAVGTVTRSAVKALGLMAVGTEVSGRDARRKENGREGTKEKSGFFHDAQRVLDGKKRGRERDSLLRQSFSN